MCTVHTLLSPLRVTDVPRHRSSGPFKVTFYFIQDHLPAEQCSEHTPLDIMATLLNPSTRMGNARWAVPIPKFCGDSCLLGGNYDVKYGLPVFWIMGTSNVVQKYDRTEVTGPLRTRPFILGTSIFGHSKFPSGSIFAVTDP